MVFMRVAEEDASDSGGRKTANDGVEECLGSELAGWTIGTERS